MMTVVLALYLSSGVSVAFMLLSFSLMHTSTYPQQQRWKFAKYFLYFFVFAIVCLVGFKWSKIEDMNFKTRVWKNYQYEIKFYELLGFKIIATARDTAKADRKALDADPNYFYEYSCEYSKSFLMEMGLIVFSACLAWFIAIQ